MDLPFVRPAAPGSSVPSLPSFHRCTVCSYVARHGGLALFAMRRDQVCVPRMQSGRRRLGYRRRRFWFSVRRVRCVVAERRGDFGRLHRTSRRPILPMTATPNHALQRTATAVTARASAAAFPPAMHGPRQPPPSLSLGSLAVSIARL